MGTDRREFMHHCAIGAASCVAQPLLAAPTSTRYERVKLVDADGRAIKLSSLKTNHNYVFNYPFATTPCFLLNLDQAMPEKIGLKTEAGVSYDWPGGVGPKKTLVAYSAICAHKLAYPSAQVSFISFRQKASRASTRKNVITCCADASVYDPFAGAKVLSGPAPQPLATILLEHDVKSDEIYAIGTFGGEKFTEFFDKYTFKLTLDSGSSDVKAPAKNTAVLKDLSNYSTQTASC